MNESLARMDDEFEEFGTNTHQYENDAKSTNNANADNYSEEETEERKEEEIIETAPLKQVEKTDFVKDTFAKFGLSMNLYSSNAGSGNFGGGMGTTEVKQGSSKVKYLIDSLPDYGFLLDSKLSIPQAFFIQ